MADRTNVTDTLPDGSTVTSLVETHDHGALDASARFGATHDTWHRESSSVPPGGGTTVTGACTGTLNFYDEGQGNEAKVEDGEPYPADTLPPDSTEVEVTVNGTPMGRYRMVGLEANGPGQFGGWAGFAEVSISAINLAAIDNSAFLAPLNNTVATIEWTFQDTDDGGGAGATVLTSISPPSLPVAAPNTTMTVTGTGISAMANLYINGAPGSMTYLNDTTLTFVCNAAFLGVGTHNVMVRTMGVPSNTITFAVT